MYVRGCAQERVGRHRERGEREKEDYREQTFYFTILRNKAGRPVVEAVINIGEAEV